MDDTPIYLETLLDSIPLPTCEFRRSHAEVPAKHTSTCAQCRTVRFVCCECVAEMVTIFTRGGFVSCAQCGGREHDLAATMLHDEVQK